MGDLMLAFLFATCLRGTLTGSLLDTSLHFCFGKTLSGLKIISFVISFV